MTLRTVVSLEEADILRGQAVGTGAEVAVAGAGEGEGGPAPVLAFEEAVAGTGEEGVLADAGIEDGVGIGAGVGHAVVAAKVGGDAEIAVEVVGEVDVPGRFVHVLEMGAGGEAEGATTEVELIFMAVGVLDDLADADFSPGVDAGLGLAENLSALLGRGLGHGLVGRLRLRSGGGLLRGCILCAGCRGSKKKNCEERIHGVSGELAKTHEPECLHCPKKKKN